MANGTNHVVNGGLFKYILEKVGIPTALLVGFSIWLGLRVADPIINSTVRYLDAQVVCAQKMTADTGEIRKMVEMDISEEKAKLLAQVLRNQETILSNQQALTKNQQVLTSQLERLASIVERLDERDRS